MSSPIIIATRGSALALAQANMILDQCRRAFPDLAFELKIIKTTGDRLQTALLARTDESLPKGLFTKELENALLEGRADLAVHSLKDLPTDLPPGLQLGAATERADVRDVLIYRAPQKLAAVPPLPPGEGRGEGLPVMARRGFPPHVSLPDLPAGAVIATSSPRRQLQALAARPDLKIVEIRGNVITRLQKLIERPELDALLLAAAGLERLKFLITSTGELKGDAVPPGLLATVIPLDVMLPCVGQAALGIEVRADDVRITAICGHLNHPATHQCVLAERAFLRAMGGGCQAPIGAHAEIIDHQVRLRVIVFQSGQSTRGELSGPPTEAEQIGATLAASIPQRGK